MAQIREIERKEKEEQSKSQSKGGQGADSESFIAIGGDHTDLEIEEINEESSSKNDLKKDPSPKESRKSSN